MFIPVILFFASVTFGAPTALGQSELVAPVSINQSQAENLDTYVREYFEDTPVLADIAWCESRMRHVGKNNTILRGMVDSDDIGVMQINTRYHEETAEELEIDIYSLHGNLAYAEHLYEKQGTKPWNASRNCWDKIAQR